MVSVKMTSFSVFKIINMNLFGWQHLEMSSVLLFRQSWELGKKYNSNFIFTFAIEKVRYGGITAAKIFKHGNYLKSLLLFCFLLLDCFYTFLFVFYLCFKSYYFINHKYMTLTKTKTLLSIVRSF